MSFRYDMLLCNYVECVQCQQLIIQDSCSVVLYNSVFM